MNVSYYVLCACQIGGADLQRINLDELVKLAPKSTRVERAVLLRTIGDLDASQVSLGSC